MNNPRLSQLDWVNAGFRALVEGGVLALRVEPVARQLGTTKGSFYWHFKGPDDWHRAMLAHYEHLGFAEIINRLTDLPPGSPRLRTLARIAVQEGRETAHGGAAVEMSLRDWARFNPNAAQALRRVDAQRENYVLDEMRSAGVAAPEKAAALFYAAYLGYQALGKDIGPALAGLDFMLDCLGLPELDRPKT